MITQKDLKKIDSSLMHLIYDDWPIIAKNAFNKKWEKIEYQDYEHIVFAGMGGSGTIGDIFAAIFSKSGKHISVCKGYNLPKTVDVKSLVIITTVSGNTSEALSILKQAIKVKCKVIVFSSGGKIEKVCKKNKINYRKIEEFNSPRASLVNYIFSVLKILENVLPYPKKDIDFCIRNLFEIKKNISSQNLSETNLALNLAKKIKGIPLIYYPWGLQAVAIRFKNTLQENSKLQVIIEDVVEASHNGVVAWEKKSNVNPILLQGKDDNIKTKEKWMAMKKFFKYNEIEYLEIYSIKGGILSKIMNLMYYLDYVTIYKAVIEKVDPTPVEAIKFIKSLTK